MQAMILGAGLGSRLRPLSLELPKPAVPIGDTPLFALQASQLRSAGFDVRAMNASYMADVLAPLAAAENLALSIETELLGTAGGVARARDRGMLFDAPLLVHNGDICTRVGWQCLLGELGTTVARLAVRRRSIGQGSVGWTETGTVCRLRDVRVSSEAYSGDFLGVHVMSADVLRALPSRGCLVGDVYIPQILTGAQITVCEVSDNVWDVGDVHSYYRACLDWAGNAWHSPQARVQPGCRTDGSVVGKGAVVRADVLSSVVWPGATVTMPTEGCVVTRTQSVYALPR